LERLSCRGVPGGLAGWLAEPPVGRAARAVRDGLSVTVLVQATDEAVALGPLLVIVPAGSALRFPADRPVLAVPVGELSAVDRRLAWLAALPELSEPD